MSEATEMGFNDDELADIMSEIESLESEISGDPTPSPEAKQASTEPAVKAVEELKPEEPKAEEPVTQEAVVEEKAVEEKPADEPSSPELKAVPEEPASPEENSPEENTGESVEVAAHVEDITEADIDDALNELEQKAEEAQAVKPVADDKAKGSNYAPIDLDEFGKDEVFKSDDGPKKPRVARNRFQDAIDETIDTICDKGAPAPESNSSALGGSANRHQSSLDFQVAGQIQLNLGFEINGKKVRICVNEAGLEVETPGGVKLTLPVD